MSEYQHYIRKDSNGIVIRGYTSAFEEPQAGDLLLPDQDGRHFTIQLTTERGQFKYKVVDGVMALRMQQELDAEWNARPAEPPTAEERLRFAEDWILEQMMGGL
jgi:hypothetical protein